MPNFPADYRFVVDEASLWVEGLSATELVLALDQLADQLHLAREREEPTGILSAYATIECRPGVRLFELLTSDSIPRDCRLRAFRLLDKCGRFDQNPSFFVDPALQIEGQLTESYALAAAIQARQLGHAVGAFALSPRYGPGIVLAVDSKGEWEIAIVTEERSRVGFYRWIYAVENIDETHFFELATLAFPHLRFAEGVSFRRFEGTYSDLRDEVVQLLAKICDEFTPAYAAHYGRSDDVSAAMGIDISNESPTTRGSEHLMRERDAVFRGRVYRCEWHAKVEPHRNRIHIHPGDEASDNCVVVGMFVKHLPTLKHL